jgi:hypothetical protein
VNAAAAGAVAELQIRHSCPVCGKRCYPKRKAARLAARRLYPGKHMREYQCGDYWHLTSRLARKKARPRRPAPRIAAAIRDPAVERAGNDLGAADEAA